MRKEQSAFPHGVVHVSENSYGEDCIREYDEPGLSIRDYFAAKALQSIYYSACADYDKNGWPEDWRMGLALDAYDMADAMLAAREAR